MHKLCGKDCDNHVCRAYFPEKQPIIHKGSKDICLGEEYETECLIYSDGVNWREERRLKGLKEKCPFATNNVCGRPWQWRCDAVYPFLLTPYETKPGKDLIPLRDKDKNIKFTKLKTDEGEEFDLHKTCLSGDETLYPTCPHYTAGLKEREEYRKRKQLIKDKA